MRRWYEFVAKDRFTPYVRHLIYYGGRRSRLRPYDFLETYGGHFLDFKNLHTLEMRHLALERFDLDLSRLAFGHLGKTLRALLIRDATLTLNKFLELLSLLPRLHCLGLDCFTVIRGPFQALKKLPVFRGTLNLSGPVNKSGFRFIASLPRMLPNFPSVRLRLNLSYDITRRLLEAPGFAKNVTTMLLGYQIGKPYPPTTGPRLTGKFFAGVPEIIDLSRCYNLRMLSIRTQGCSERISTSLAIQEKFFRLLETITSRELEFIIVEASSELSLMRYGTWEYFFNVFSALQASCQGLSIAIEPYERFMVETFRKGETLARFLGCRN